MGNRRWHSFASQQGATTSGGRGQAEWRQQEQQPRQARQQGAGDSGRWCETCRCTIPPAQGAWEQHIAGIRHRRLRLSDGGHVASVFEDLPSATVPGSYRTRDPLVTALQSGTLAESPSARSAARGTGVGSSAAMGATGLSTRELEVLSQQLVRELPHHTGMTALYHRTAALLTPQRLAAAAVSLLDKVAHARQQQQQQQQQQQLQQHGVATSMDTGDDGVHDEGPGSRAGPSHGSASSNMDDERAQSGNGASTSSRSDRNTQVTGAAAVAKRPSQWPGSSTTAVACPPGLGGVSSLTLCVSPAEVACLAALCSTAAALSLTDLDITVPYRPFGPDAAATTCALCCLMANLQRPRAPDLAAVPLAVGPGPHAQISKEQQQQQQQQQEEQLGHESRHGRPRQHLPRAPVSAASTAEVLHHSRSNRSSGIACGTSTTVQQQVGTALCPGLARISVGLSKGQYLALLAQGGARPRLLAPLWHNVAQALGHLVQTQLALRTVRVCTPPGVLCADDVVALDAMLRDHSPRVRARLAFLSGSHARLGSGSGVRRLPREVLEAVLQEAVPRSPAALDLVLLEWMPGSSDEEGDDGGDGDLRDVWGSDIAAISRLLA